MQQDLYCKSFYYVKSSKEIIMYRTKNGRLWNQKNISQLFNYNQTQWEINHICNKNVWLIKNKRRLVCNVVLFVCLLETGASASNKNKSGLRDLGEKEEVKTTGC